MRSLQRTLLLLFLLTGSVFLFLPSNTSSNPIVFTSLRYDSGGLFFGENVSMPEADVHIVLDPYVEEEYNLESSFILTSEVNQTIHTAFAYPQEWDFSGTKTQSCDFEIRFNQEEIDFEILTFDQVLSIYNESIISNNSWNVDNWIWMADHHFAAFNLSFVENTSTILEVDGSTSVEFPTGGYNAAYGFRYCVGSANSWGGVTHETIRIDVRASTLQTTRIDTGIINWTRTSFLPEEGLTETHNNTWTTAVWNLEMHPDSNEITHVEFQGHYYASYDPMGSLTSSLVDFAVLVIPTTGLVIIGLLYFRRRINVN